MKLAKKSIKWAIKHLINLSDTDLFPNPYEFYVINDIIDDAVDVIANKDICSFIPGPSRKFIIPKDDLSYRIGTQLDPLDSILLTAIIHEYGELLEKNRIPISSNIVFSYRFKPDPKGHFYSRKVSWNSYWKEACKLSQKYNYATILDISDFYNQIYHHSVENILIERELPESIVSYIMRLFGSVTSKMSRGIPVGPHSVHLIAEAVLSSIDNSLLDKDIKFIRYVDDYILFSDDKITARKQILIFAEILDKQQRLIVQRHKTKILTSSELEHLCSENIQDRPINVLEGKLLDIIKKYSRNNPYETLNVQSFSDKEKDILDKSDISMIFQEYLKEKNPNYIRLRWLLKRLSQLGHPFAIEYLLKNISKLLPIMNDIFKYLVSISNSNGLKWPDIGKDLIKLRDLKLVEGNLYYLLIIYSIFNRKPELNNRQLIINKFNSAPPEVRREIIFLAFVMGLDNTLREFKESYPNFDPWTKRAFLIASSQLPKDERKFFLRNNVNKGSSVLDQLIVDWANKDGSQKFYKKIWSQI